MSMYPGSMDYDLGVSAYDDPTQPTGPADAAPTAGTTTASVTLPSMNIQVSHGIAIIFLLSLAIYSGAAYVLFRKINQAI